MDSTVSDPGLCCARGIHVFSVSVDVYVVRNLPTRSLLTVPAWY